MWNRVTQQNIDSFEDFIGIYKLCKSRGTDEQRLDGFDFGLVQYVKGGAV